MVAHKVLKEGGGSLHLFPQQGVCLGSASLVPHVKQKPHLNQVLGTPNARDMLELSAGEQGVHGVAKLVEEVNGVT